MGPWFRTVFSLSVLTAWMLVPVLPALGTPRADPQPAQPFSNDLTEGDRTAIRALKAAFDQVPEKRRKQMIARTVLEAGERDQRLFDYLAQYARLAVESDMPDPLLYDAQGRSVRGQPNPAFLEWVQRKNLDLDQAVEDALYNLPGDVIMLADAADARAVPILLRGLLSPNYTIITASASGLARLQEPSAVRPIIAAADRAPAEAAGDIAWALVFFDDPTAQTAAERFIRDQGLLARLRERARTEGPKGALR